MKQFFGKKSRNALTLVILTSLVLHVVALLIFGTIKFVSAVLREETVFEAAPVEVTPQKEPEYNVNIQQRNQSTPPPKPPVLAVNNPSNLDIPSLDIDLNVETSAVIGRTAGGFSGGGLTAVREMATNFKLTDFGYTGQTAGTLEGTLIDLKRDQKGKPINVDRVRAIREFTDGTWTLSRLTDKYYAAQNKLYAAYWIITMGTAAKAPVAFGVEGEIEPSGIIAYYDGTFTPDRNMRMRFAGAADDVIIARLNSKIVFDGSRRNEYSSYNVTDKDRPHGATIAGMNTRTAYGDWVSLRAGTAYDLKILLAEVPGGSFGCMLFYQLQGDDKMRVFSTKPLTPEEKKVLEKMHPDIAAGL